MRVALVLSLLVFTACGRGRCDLRKGTYTSKLSVRTGDCGDQRESLFTVVDQPLTPTAPCTGTISYSEDNCEVTHDEVCPVAADGSMREGKFSVKGVVWWNGDATKATGLFEYRLDALTAAESCQGTYDATYNKL